MPGKDSRTFVYVLCHAILLCFMGSSCALVDEYFKEKVEEETRNRVAAPGGTPSEEETPPETQSDIVVNSVQPGRGLTIGEEEVEIVDEEDEDDEANWVDLEQF